MNRDRYDITISSTLDPLNTGKYGNMSSDNNMLLSQTAIYLAASNSQNNNSTGESLRYDQSEIIKRTVLHELAHALGLKDGDLDQNGNPISIMKNAITEGDGGILWMSDQFNSQQALDKMISRNFINEHSTGTTQSGNSSSFITEGSTGLISQYQENDGIYWNNFYYYDDTNPQYIFDFNNNGITDPSGNFLGYSTGYQNLTTGEIIANLDDEHLYMSTGNYGSTGESTGG